IHTICSHNEIRFPKFIQICDPALEMGLYTDRPSPRLQQGQKLQPLDGCKSDAVDADLFASMTDRDVLPGFKMRQNRLVGFRIILGKKLKRTIGKNNPETKCHIRWVLINQQDVGIALTPLEQISEI